MLIILYILAFIGIPTCEEVIVSFYHNYVFLGHGCIFRYTGIIIIDTGKKVVSL